MVNPTATTVTEIVYHYVPNQIAAGIAVGVFFVVSAILFWHTFRARSWWSLCLPIGAFFYALGFILRITLAINEETLDNLSLFIFSQLDIICAPAAFLAFNYILYGRLLTGKIRPEYSLMRPAIVSRVFIISDVTTFLAQVCGGGLTAIQSLGNVGRSIMIAGLAAQLASYIVFWIMFTVVHIRASRAGDLYPTQPWHKLLWVLHFSSACITIRCVFRTAEWAVPSDHTLATKEWIFYLLDVVTLFFGIVVYCFWWPASYISQGTEGKGAEWDHDQTRLPMQNFSPRYSASTVEGAGDYTRRLGV